MIELINRNRHVQKITGSSIFGADTSKLPVRLVDACQLVQIERERVEMEQFENSRARARNRG